MAETVRISLVSNAGLIVSSGSTVLAVDALNALYPPFRQVDRDTAESMIRDTGRYAGVTGLFYTHLHEDHYDPCLAERFYAAHPGAYRFVPDDGTPPRGRIEGEGFTLEYGRIPHSGLLYSGTHHYVFLLSLGGRNLYIAGDAEYDSNAQLDFLAGRAVDAAFFNPIAVFSEKNIALMQAVDARVNFLYHVPEDHRSGLWRKTAACLKRYDALLQNTVFLDAVPSFIRL